MSNKKNRRRCCRRFSPTPLGQRVDFPFGIGLTMVAYGGRLNALKGLYHLPQAPIGGGLMLVLGVGLAPFEFASPVRLMFYLTAALGCPQGWAGRARTLR